MRLGGKQTSADFSLSGNPGIYQRAVRLMVGPISEPLRVTTIARQLGVCTTSLKNAFAECAGKGAGVKAFFIEMKIERAKEMLESGTNV